LTPKEALPVVSVTPSKSPAIAGESVATKHPAGESGEERESRGEIKGTSNVIDVPEA
jgi:hypothetical protein